jgi:hypothetical protein
MKVKCIKDDRDKGGKNFTKGKIYPTIPNAELDYMIICDQGDEFYISNPETSFYFDEHFEVEK